MRWFLCSLLTLTVSLPAIASDPTWRQQRVLSEFVAEGSAAADFDGDGHVDLTSGPFWWPGPSFAERHQLLEPKFFNPGVYSDHFFSFVADVNGDQRPDIIAVGFPGREATLYLNPGNVHDVNRWPATVIADQVSNESPALVDLIAGGLPELVCSRNGAFGYYQPGDDPTQMWKWHAVSEPGVTATPFGHGLGVGDVDNDGRLDVIGLRDWWRQPETNGSDLWKPSRWADESYGGGGAQIFAHDVNRDGHPDIVTSLNAHGFGIAWYEAKVTENGERRFLRHDIVGATSVENRYGVAFSQPHALTLANIDGDGQLDLVTGKRWWAHNGKDVGGNQAPVLYWFKIVVDESTPAQVDFVPHLVDNESGVGTDVLAVDLNRDGRTEIVSANKRGVVVHWNDASDKSIVDTSNGPMRSWLFGVHDESDFEKSRTAEDAVKAMQLPEGFTADVIASEPQMSQPIAMCFDSRGRIWLAEGHTYPVRAPEGEGKDRILIFEDTDADGTFETQKVFAENLNLVSGIEIGFGGVWVGAAPYFMFIPDADGDDVPDKAAQVLLDGWGYQDTHETLNSFKWGPDGWLYGCHGVFTHSKVGKPGTAENDRVPLNAAIWRYHPTRHTFEIFSEGGSNPWGIDYNERGDWFMECCVIPHLFHVMQGARYHRQAGQHFNPYIYNDLPTIADHLHYGDGSFGTASDQGRSRWVELGRSGVNTSMVGGGHAHCGMAIYLGDSFPTAYRGDLFIHNLHGHRMVREAVERDGSGYVGRHRPDFARARDHSFVGVGVMLGPDGSLFISDWHDPQTCHHRDPNIWDRTNGRIYRLRYGDVKSTTVDLPGMSDLELVALLSHTNAWFARHAAHQLHQRHAAGTLDRDRVEVALREASQSSDDPHLRLQLLWAEHVCGFHTEESLVTLLDDREETIRGWAIQLLCEANAQLSPSVLARLVKVATEETSPVTRRYLASALQRMTPADRWEVATPFVRSIHDPNDKNLPLLVWYGIEPLVAEDASRALAMVDGSPDATLRDKVLRRAASFEAGRDALVAYVGKSPGVADWTRRSDALLNALPNVGKLSMPQSWETTRDAALGLSKEGDEGQRLANIMRRLGARFGDESMLEAFRQQVADASAPVSARVDALNTLRASKAAGTARVAVSVLDVGPLQRAAMEAIVESADASVAPQLVDSLPTLPADLRPDAINFLATRVETAKQLLTAIAEKRLDRSFVPLALLRQMKSLGDKDVDLAIGELWGNLGTAPADLEKQMQHWRGILSPRNLADADLNHGRHVFNQVCGNCHKLFGEGQVIGPDLTGSNRTDLGYVLDNVLAPNAIIGNAYQMHSLLMNDGRLLTGLIKSENDQSINLIMSAGTEVSLDPNEIEERKLSDQSMMPMELFDKMPHVDVIDLVAYLASPNQVPASETRRLKQSLVLEAESILSYAKATHGRIQAQDMKPFQGEWSGGSHLWWVGAANGAKLTIDVPSPATGPTRVRLRLTTAPDYANIRARVNDSKWIEADLYHPTVSLYEQPMQWDGVVLESGKPARIEIELTGKNPKAAPNWMIGLDYVEFIP